MKVEWGQHLGFPAELEVKLREGSWRMGRMKAEGLKPRGSSGRWGWEVGPQVPRASLR